MTDQCQILIWGAEYHILVYLVNSGEIEKCSFLVRLNLVWHKLNLGIKSLISFFNECTQIINSPLCCVLDAWNTLSKFVSLTWNFQISFINSLHLFLIFPFPMSICFFSFYWIEPSHFSETKIYVQNNFKAANTTLLSSKLWYNFLTMK